MTKRTPVVILAAALVAAGAFAVFHPASQASADSQASAQSVESPPPETHSSATESPILPPGHPTIGSDSNGQAMPPPMQDQSSAAALTWSAPTGWNVLPNPSTMRLATYRIPRAAGDTEDTDLSVVRAGGTPEANIERWVGQFDNAGKDVRTVKLVHGLKVTIVEVKGAFLGGGMTADNTPSSHPGWALLGAIVEARDMPYFFKMTGPAKSVAAARPAFDALIASATPASRT